MILGFKDRFVAPIVAGTKVHTIRSGSRWRPGMKIHFFEKVRQRGMRKIREDATCTEVQRIELRLIPGRTHGYLALRIDNHWISDPAELEAFASADGFTSYAEFGEFFQQMHTLPFDGQLVHWTGLFYS